VAYAFARFEFWGKQVVLFGVMVATMMLPLIVLRIAAVPDVQASWAGWTPTCR
jgi:ABC-type glycerol-3-phosphate transport system permease component